VNLSRETKSKLFKNMKKPTLKQLLLAKRSREYEIAKLRREIRKINKEIDKKL
jgi:hypothetical protein